MRSPTYTHYASDGLGRDSYILVNNGGLTVTKVGQPPVTKGFFDCSVSRPLGKLDRTFYGSNRSLAKDPPSFYYPPDGTGRDFYIIKNNGGLISNYGKPANHYFEQNLR